VISLQQNIRQTNKTFLINVISFSFFYFMSFWSILRWNRYVKVVYKCRTCENKFFSNFGELYLCNETSNRQNKICFGNIILFLFFVCYNFWFKTKTLWLKWDLIGASGASFSSHSIWLGGRGGRRDLRLGLGLGLDLVLGLGLSLGLGFYIYLLGTGGRGVKITQPLLYFIIFST
jgi:hypothetical protein